METYIVKLYIDRIIITFSSTRPKKKTKIQKERKSISIAQG